MDYAFEIATKAERFGQAGTAILYAAKAGYGPSLMQCDFEIHPKLEPEVRDVKAILQSRRLNRQKASEPTKHNVDDQLIVVLGPNMSAKSAVAALRSMVDEILTYGLVVGITEHGYLRDAV
jgi:hypothetical protein